MSAMHRGTIPTYSEVNGSRPELLSPPPAAAAAAAAAAAVVAVSSSSMLMLDERSLVLPRPCNAPSSIPFPSIEYVFPDPVAAAVTVTVTITVAVIDTMRYNGKIISG
jgi:hypothetical protein